MVAAAAFFLVVEVGCLMGHGKLDVGSWVFKRGCMGVEKVHFFGECWFSAREVNFI